MVEYHRTGENVKYNTDKYTNQKLKKITEHINDNLLSPIPPVHNMDKYYTISDNGKKLIPPK